VPEAHLFVLMRERGVSTTGRRGQGELDRWVTVRRDMRGRCAAAVRNSMRIWKFAIGLRPQPLKQQGRRCRASMRTVADRPVPDRDPVLARRARIGRMVALGQQIGYSLWLVAIVVFVVGAITGFRPAMVTVVIGCLAAGSALLAPSIVISYGVRAADRDERRGSGGGH